MEIQKYNIEEHLNNLPPTCNYLTEEIKHSTWQNAIENKQIPIDTFEEDYDYELICVMRKKKENGTTN